MNNSDCSRTVRSARLICLLRLNACRLHAMDRRNRRNRTTGACWLLLLVLVSVIAPVWAETYVCPMAKAELDQVKPCCAKTAVLHRQATPGNPQIEPACDCPKLSWSADATDQVRELRSASDNTVALHEIPAVLLVVPTISVGPRSNIERAVSRFLPPLWLRNQSILC